MDMGKSGIATLPNPGGAFCILGYEIGDPYSVSNYLHSQTFYTWVHFTVKSGFPIRTLRSLVNF